MDSAYAQYYRQLHEKHWWWLARQDQVLATLAEWQPRGSSGHILDIGCGDGLLFDKLAEYGRVEGIEVDPAIVSPDNRWRDRITIGPFDERFQPGKYYDTILMLDVLEHLPDPRAALQHAVELLTPSGNLLITVPAFRWLWTSHDELNHHYTRYSRQSFRQLAEGLGGIRSMRYFFHWLFPAKLAVRAKEMFIASPPQLPRIPPAAVNRVLYGWTRLEQMLVGRLPIPFGGSLMAVLSK